MASIVLRVSGLALDVDACLALIPQLSRSDCYRAGDVGHLRRVHAKSGFNFVLSDDDYGEGAALPLAVQRLSTMAPVLAQIWSTGASGDLDCGIFVGADSTVSLDVTPAILAALATSGVTLRVTAYPCDFLDAPDDVAGTE